MTDVDPFVRGFSEAMDEIETISWDTAETLARTAAAEQRRTAPKRTGIAARSISTARGRDAEGPFIDFGPTRRGFHLTWAEYGKSDQPARPFIRPAIERAIATVWPR